MDNRIIAIGAVAVIVIVVYVMMQPSKPAIPTAQCGDNLCASNESCSSCPSDCECPATCGDGSCSGGETCSSCESDCGACAATCGDGSCSGGETCSSCESDCGACAATCGDGVCSGETCSSCPSDCGACGSAAGTKIDMLYSLHLGSDAFSLPDDDIEEMFRIAKEELGVNYVKIAPAWRSIELAKGQYDWSKFDKIADMVDKYGLKTLVFHLQSGNPRWAVKDAPGVDVSQCQKHMGFDNQAPKDPQDQADFLGNFTKRYKDKMGISFIELENEPLTPCLWGDTPEYLAEVDNAVYERISSLFPEVKVCSASLHQPIAIGGTSIADDTAGTVAFLGTYLDNLDKIDCFSMHDYAYTGWTQTNEYIFSTQYDLEDNLRGFLADHGKGDVPIIDTECAYGPEFMGEELGAAQLAQGYLLSHAKGKVEGRFCQAVAMGVTVNIAGGEDFGMVVLGNPNEYRAGYYAFKTMRNIMLQYPNHAEHIAGEVNGAGYWAERFEGGGKSIYVAFVPIRFEGHSQFGNMQSPAPQTTSLSVGAGTFRVTTMEGDVYKASSDSQGVLRLQIGAGPVYIEACDSCSGLAQYTYSAISGSAGGPGTGNSGPQTGNSGPGAGKCGDGTCDDMERQMGVCPADCSTQTGNPGPGAGKCGDGNCDQIERQMGVCPQDCP